jgi:hypothetical protein
MNKITVFVEQTLVDIAVQYLGNAEAAYELAQLNNLSVTAALVNGQELMLPEVSNANVAQFFKQSNYIPSVSFDDEQEGIDYDIVEVNLEVI